MSLPREVIPGRFYLITRRCTQRMFLMRPDDVTNNAFVYCLAVASERARIQVLFSCAMSNHHHTVIYDPEGTYPVFLEHFHKLFAKCQNAHRGRWENFWSAEKTSVVRLVDRADVIRKIVYAAANPVADHLVDRVDHWPGVNTLRALKHDRLLHAHRPHHFFRAGGRMPAEVALRLLVPQELGLRTELVAEVLAGVRAAEANAARDRASCGRRVLGRAACLQQSWKRRPSGRELRRNLAPTVAAINKWARTEALLRNREFVTAYRCARRAWLDGHDAKFPPGTYWLHRFAGVTLASRTVA